MAMGMPDWKAPDPKSNEVYEVIPKLKECLDSKRIRSLPWRYGDLAIDGRIFPQDHIFNLDGKTFARAAVNALPLLFAEIERLQNGFTPLPKADRHAASKAAFFAHYENSRPDWDGLSSFGKDAWVRAAEAARNVPAA